MVFIGIPNLGAPPGLCPERPYQPQEQDIISHEASKAHAMSNEERGWNVHDLGNFVVGSNGFKCVQIIILCSSKL